MLDDKQIREMMSLIRRHNEPDVMSIASAIIALASSHNISLEDAESVIFLVIKQATDELIDGGALDVVDLYRRIVLGIDDNKEDSSK